MKSPDSTRAAAAAALHLAGKDATAILTCLRHLHPADTAASRKYLPKARALLAGLNKHLHEFNAYHNVLTTT